MSTRNKQAKRFPRPGGFSLIELMVVVAIIGLLAMIAYPSYQKQMLRTHRTEGQAALQDAATRQERFFSNKSEYTINVTNLGLPASGLTDNGYYQISAAACGGGTIARCYTLTATAQGAQADDTDCVTITLGSNGQKLPAECW